MSSAIVLAKPGCAPGKDCCNECRKGKIGSLDPASDILSNSASIQNLIDMASTGAAIPTTAIDNAQASLTAIVTDAGSLKGSGPPAGAITYVAAGVVAFGAALIGFAVGRMAIGKF